jgi:dipeptide/tripeptide permease
MGFGIFYQMINIGATFGPLMGGYFRAISWNYVFISSAVSVVFMLIVTIIFYKEPPREVQGESVSKKLKDIWIVLSDYKFSIFLILVGLFFWIPLWAFINLNAIYIDKYLDTANLYVSLKGIFGETIANFISHVDEHGIRRVMGESIASSAPFIILFQSLISYINQKFNTIYAFVTGMIIAAIGYLFLAMAHFSVPSFVFLGIFFYAVGEMCTSPRIQEYIGWLAPKEKAGLYMGTHFLATGLGAALSGVTYTTIFGWFREMGHPEYVWYALAAHYIIGAFIIHFYTKSVGHFKELDA